MKAVRLVAACITLLGVPLIAVAAPGDPRLVNGVLEWPRTVTTESFVIVRGDDGILYYVGLGASRRDGTMTAGSRVAVLGIEGRSAHEMTAVGVGTGATTEAALAQLQGARAATAPVAAPTPTAPPAAAVAAPAAPPAAPAVAASPAPVAAPSTAPAAAAPVAAPNAPAATAPTAAPTGPAGSSPPPSSPTAVSPKAPAPAPAPTTTAQSGPAAGPVGSSTPAAGAAAPATNGTVSPAPSGVVPAANTSPKATVAPPPLALSAPMLPVEERRWTEVSGEIEAFVGRTVILKVDGGRVTVDVSGLSGNLERIVGPGSKVRFYGVPVELRFKAMGFIDPDARAPEARGRVR